MDALINGKWALVTGASSGLGVDFAGQLAGNGCNVILVARREKRLRENKQKIERDYGVEAITIPIDLLEENAPDRLFETIERRGLQVDVLINNAGFGLYGNFADLEWERELQMLQLDIITVTHLTKLYAKDMLKRNFGYILQISSIGAYQPTPTYASYSAAKSYVLNFSEALHYELRKTNVSCTVISPGITRTEFLKVSGQTPSLYQRLAMMESEEVARIGIDAMLKRKMSVIPGFFNKLTILASKVSPERLKTAIAYITMNK